MTHTLTIALGDDADLRWAQATVTAAHYLHAPVDLAGPDRHFAAHHAAVLKGDGNKCRV